MCSRVREFQNALKENDFMSLPFFVDTQSLLGPSVFLGLSKVCIKNRNVSNNFCADRGSLILIIYFFVSVSFRYCKGLEYLVCEIFLNYFRVSFRATQCVVSLSSSKAEMISPIPSSAH